MNRNEMKVMISDICQAFNTNSIGSRVKPAMHTHFKRALVNAIMNHDFSKDKFPGQSIIELSKNVNDWVFPGTWFRNSKNPNDYVFREYRGEVGMYLKRTPEMRTDHVSCVVYSKGAYEKDPDFDEHEAMRVGDFFGHDEGFVLVAVLGDCDSNRSTVSYSRFVKNLAGANNEYKVMTKDEIVAKAQEVVE
jgi:hypothetical protein